MTAVIMINTIILSSSNVSMPTAFIITVPSLFVPAKTLIPLYVSLSVAPHNPTVGCRGPPT